MITQLSASNLCLSSFDAAVDAISRAGFFHFSVAFTGSQFRKDLHEFDEWETEELAHKADLFGLRIVAVETRSNILTAAGIAHLHAAIRVAGTLGVDVLDLRAPSSAGRDSTESAENARLFADGVRQAADAAEEAGVVLCLETNGVLATLQHCLEALALVNHPQVGIAFDPAAVVCSGAGDPSADLDELLPFIGHVHARDCVRTETGPEFVTVGKGELDWDALLTRLGDGGFGGYVSVDHVSGDTDDERAAELVTAHDFLLSVVA